MSGGLAAIEDFQFDLLLSAPFCIGGFPVFVSSHTALLRDDQFDKGFAMRVFLEGFEGGFLVLGHGTTNAMSLTLEFADADAGAGNFRHFGLA
ncbi:hypothetical protein MCRY_15040 [Marivita cryptomonadis]|nr:hypothetical protein MCRY_15040 [Marivita cryptomonadis]